MTCASFESNRRIHSFPTRRSSDLVQRRGAGGEHELQLPGAGDGCGGEPERVLERDRKSTRLNSSHTVTSYAVFCLKKKTVEPAVAHQQLLHPHRIPGHGHDPGRLA